MQTKNPIQAIAQSRRISNLCQERESILKLQLSKILKAKSSTVKIWLQRDRQADKIKRHLETLENRRQNAWNAATNFQGRYINWKNLHTIEGKTYCGIFELIHAADQYKTA